jgi:epoxide hydrolase 4
MLHHDRDTRRSSFAPNDESLPHLLQLMRDCQAHTGYADTGEVRLHYIACGRGPLVLLLHGFPECWYGWRHQLAALSDQYCVVALDLRGYNRSEKPPRVRDYRMERLTSDVLGVIRYFGARQAAIVGHDWGAAIAWAVAEQAPQYVSQLAALQVPPMTLWWRNLTLQQVLRSWYMLGFQLPWLPEWVLRRRHRLLLERLLRETAVRPRSMSEEDLAVYHDAWQQEGALTAAVNYYRANLLRFFFERHHHPGDVPDRQIAAPTLFIYGEQDVAVVPATVRDVGRYVAGPYHELRIPNAGHWVQNEAPAQVNAALRRLLEGH